eukprot:gnl/TRDRNA2_/TRDRNA2_134593_c1_seq4.p1 gnl/TRDRNA2_/TRDRNA2_134593_c1~~gnl/TRDRNA2_/TRDRNA2_134593_c1_seq4.p1  ORF type:complete len:222 (-),score=33.48 gnl/TRDRNA2_/TRDRNA2_134593_c1_seq4:14-679(-)
MIPPNFPPESRASYMFFVAEGRDEETNRRVAEEMNQFGDIVQLSFPDTFLNLAVKSVAAAAWYIKQLDTSIVKFWLKVEDYMGNSFHDIDTLVAQLSLPHQGAMYYGGGMIFGGNDVMREGRWGCPRHHCPYDKFPIPYAGGQYLLSLSAVRILVDQGLPKLDLHDPYPIEDNFVATTLADAGVRAVHEAKLMWDGNNHPYRAPSVTVGNYLLCESDVYCG